MIYKYAIALAIVLLLAAFFAWAFLPARHLPGNRARHLRDPSAPATASRQRLRPPVQPVAALGPPSRTPPLVPDSDPASRCATASWTPASTRCSSAAPTTGTACGSLSKSTSS